MAEVGPNIGAAVVVGGGSDTRSDAVRSERREAVREEARANFDAAERMVSEYVNRTSMPRTRADLAPIRDLIRTFYSPTQLSDREVDILFTQRFPEAMGVTNPEPAVPNQPNTGTDTGEGSRGGDPRDARSDPRAGGDRFVKNPNAGNAQPLVAKSVPVDHPAPLPGSPPPPPPGAPPPPPPGSPLPQPGSTLLASTDGLTGTLVDPLAEPLPNQPVVVAGSAVVPTGDPAEPLAPVRVFNFGHSFGPGRDPNPDDVTRGLADHNTFNRLLTRGGNAAGSPTPNPMATAAGAGTTVASLMRDSWRLREGGGSSERGSDDAGGDSVGGSGKPDLNLAFVRGSHRARRDTRA
ncbi:MAG TPA: hypothetical protein VFX30_14020 [bacterium]|nr:hypothetical protein [bacterium]